jgi:hypothetical protein
MEKVEMDREILLFPSLTRSLDPEEKVGSGNSQRITKAEKKVHGGRFVFVFKLTDVGAINLCRKSKLLLR